MLIHCSLLRVNQYYFKRILFCVPPLFLGALQNQQMGANQEKRAAAKIIRFITWVADYNR